MNHYLQAALYSQLVEFHGMTDDICRQVQRISETGQPRQIVYYIQDRSVAPGNSRTTSLRFRDLLASFNKMRDGVEGPNDFATLLENFQKITGKPFKQPPWLSSEMRKIELPDSSVQ